MKLMHFGVAKFLLNGKSNQETSGVCKELYDTTTQENEQEAAAVEALIEAAKCGQLEQVQRLCEEVGVDADLRGYMGWTAAHWAAREGHITVLEYLQRIGTNLDTLDRRGDSLLHKAAANAQYNACEWLLNHNFNVHATNNNGMTPIDMVRERAQQEKDIASAQCEALLLKAYECTF